MIEVYFRTRPNVSFRETNGNARTRAGRKTETNWTRHEKAHFLCFSDLSM